MSHSRAMVFLVRHGAVHNPHGLRYGRLPGYGLSAAGRAQAVAAAAWLTQQTPRVVAVWSSPLDRARETAVVLADVLCPARGVVSDDRLAEAVSWLDGLPRRPSLWAVSRRLREGLPARPESLGAVAERMRAAIDAAAESAPGAAIVLVSHQLPIQAVRLAVEQGLGAPDASWRVRLAPWSLPRGACDYGSATVLAPRGDAYAVGGYWVPRDGEGKT